MPKKMAGSRNKPKRVRLRQHPKTVSCEDIKERCDYIGQCMDQRQPVDMRQLLNLLKLTEMYNKAVNRKA